MKRANAFLIFCAFFLLDIGAAQADTAHTLHGVVITPDGMMVPEFRVTIRPVVDHPELIRRKHFKQGEFTLQGLTREKYKIIITAPKLVGVKLDVDFGTQQAVTDYRIAILHRSIFCTIGPILLSPIFAERWKSTAQIPPSASTSLSR